MATLAEKLSGGSTEQAPKTLAGKLSSAQGSLAQSQMLIDKQRVEKANQAASLGIGSKINPDTQGIGVGSSPDSGAVSGAAGLFNKYIGQPFISLAAKPVQLLAKGLGQEDPYANKALGGVEVSNPSLKGTAGDILKAGATAAGIAAAPTTVPGAIATGAGIGGSTFAGQALQQEKPIASVATEGAKGAAIGGATAGIVSGIGKLAGYLGERIQRGVIKPSKADMEDGFSMDTIKQYNLGGSLNAVREKTQAKLSELTNELGTKLASSKERLDLDKVFNETVKELTDASKLKGFGANTKVMNGLNQLKEEITLVNQQGGVSIPEAQIIKQAAGGFGAWQYGKPDPDSKATEIIYNAFYNKLKKAIEKASPEGVQGINKELSKLIPVMNAVTRRLPVAERSNVISLNEMIGLVGSSVNPIALGPTLLALISRSGTAGNALSKIAEPIQRAAVPAGLTTSKMGEQAVNTGQ